MFKYAIKRVFRGYRLFVALTIGVVIATTFFSSMLMSADLLSKEAVTQGLEGYDYDAQIVANNMTWSVPQFDEVEQIMEDLPEVSSADRYTKFSFNYNRTLGQSFDVYGLDESSTLWSSLTFINGSSSLSANETVVVASSVNATLLSTGDVMQVPITYFVTGSPFPRTVMLNLTVAAFCDISEVTAQTLNPPRVIDLGFIQIPMGDWRDYDLLLVDWEETVRPILEWYESQENVTGLGVTEGFLVQLDRSVLINPYDISGSSSNVQNALAKLEDRTAMYNTNVKNLIGTVLMFLSFASTGLVITYVALAAPVIFMSWYCSTMLSDVSYNLRRREFGLLQTKGFGPRSIKSMLNLEGMIIGLLGGLGGLVLGAYLSHIVVGVSLESPLIVLATNPVNTVVVTVFGIMIAYWSVRGPADRASRLDPLDSLKQYIYIEEQREYKRLLPTVAVLLGTYKIIVWILGINMSTLLASAFTSNLIFVIIVALWTPVDSFLNFAGPIMFLYGVTKILLRGSQRFQEWVVSAGRRFFGAFGNLATRNVRRNPVRNAALVFVVALIVSYGIYSVGSLFSEQDQRDRTDLYNVGSDVSAVFAAGTNLTSAMASINNLDGVVSRTVEYQITLGTTRGALETRGIDAVSWSQAAFHENEWFSGASFSDLMSNFTGQKIILSVSVARQLELRVGNNVTVRSPSGSPYVMHIIGLVGYTSPLEDILGQFAFGGDYPSYVPLDFLNDTNMLGYSEPHILLKTETGTNGTALEQQIADIAPSVTGTDSATSRAAERTEATFEVGNIRARWLGVLFAVVLAIVGTGLVVSLTLREKEYETSLLSVRGFTKSQVLKVLVAEIMVMILFSLLLGAGTGIIQLFGSIANTSQSTQSLVRPRMVFDLAAVLGMGAIVLGIVISAVVPIIMTSRFDEKKIDVLRE